VLTNDTHEALEIISNIEILDEELWEKLPNLFHCKVSHFKNDGFGVDCFWEINMIMIFFLE